MFIREFDSEWNPLITDDMGRQVIIGFEGLAIYLNDQFESIPAAMEYYGIEPAPIPDLI